MEISLKDLKFNKHGEEYNEGYRIVYFYDDNYTIGEYCKRIEGFMIGFAECNAILDENDIPKFTSIDNLLSRYLEELPNANYISIYTINGECIATKTNSKHNSK